MSHYEFWWIKSSDTYSSLLRSIGSWYLNIQWLGDILERDHHTVMQLLKCFLKIKRKKILPSKSWKNHLKKLLTLAEIPSFQKFSYSAQTARMAEFMFPNVVYRATVYRTGVVVCTSFSLEEQSLHTMKNGIKVFLFKLSKMEFLQEKAFNEILLWRNAMC